MVDGKLKLRLGDVVELASGGPPMTITGKGSLEHYYECMWFAPGGGELQTHEIFIGALQHPDWYTANRKPAE